MQETILADSGHVVVAGLLRRRGRVLVVHRAPSRHWYPDAWDLPGGHVDDEETPRHALARELEEELGIAANVSGDGFARVEGIDFRMDIWIIDHWTGEPFNRQPAEHDALAWLTGQELSKLRVADSRLPHLLDAAVNGPQQ